MYISKLDVTNGTSTRWIKVEEVESYDSPLGYPYSVYTDKNGRSYIDWGEGSNEVIAGDLTDLKELFEDQLKDELVEAIADGDVEVVHEVQPETYGDITVWSGVYRYEGSEKHLRGKEYIIDWDYPDVEDVDNPEDPDSWVSATDWDNITRIEEVEE